ncbi:unnamed protein product [Schistosoma margrebowiei]|uniref:Uncharacterized protein n=1 Tax=Schistosoma margrebowiei TaxID=48269 RepID=A0A183LJZ6_9TREM|nr:unnamed protein product [Schistosoma margrebowiei]
MSTDISHNLQHGHQNISAVRSRKSENYCNHDQNHTGTYKQLSMQHTQCALTEYRQQQLLWERKNQFPAEEKIRRYWKWIGCNITEIIKWYPETMANLES